VGGCANVFTESSNKKARIILFINLVLGAMMFKGKESAKIEY
jgi:hypothetical protein